VDQQAIFRAEIRISLASPTIDATTAPDSASTMRMSIITRPPPKPLYVMPPRPIIVGTIDNMPLHLSDHSNDNCSKNDALGRGNDADAIIVQSRRHRSGVFLVVARVK
jgi:hypothetical protein